MAMPPLASLAALMRPYQYVKNLFIFLPAFFALQLRDSALLGRTAAAFAAFCLLASAVYILNDYIDREEDRQHPAKRSRPLASGAITPFQAFALMALLLLTAALLMGLTTPGALPLAGLYFALNIAYSLKLKHIPLLDIFIIATGFVLRLFVGAVAGGITLSMWIILMTFLLALFLALAKRRDDVLLMAEGKKVRKAIDGYNLEFINGAMIIMASVTIVAYISYTISPSVQAFFHNDHLYYTVVFVLLGVLRYMQITFVEARSGNPARILLSDLFLQLTLLGWIVTFVLLIYM